MARKILDYDGTVVPVSTAYPYGDIKDNPGGTKVNGKSNSDIQQLMQRMMFRAGITPSSLADNVTNGFQLMQALYRLINEEISGLAETVGAAGFTAVRASGIVTTPTPPTFTVSAGWFFYNNQFVKFLVGGYSNVVPVGSEPYVVLSTTDGLPTATVQVLTSTTPENASQFKMHNMREYADALGLVAIEADITALYALVATLSTQVSSLLNIPAWTNISSFGVGWAVASFQPKYTKDAPGRVQLRGSISNPVSTSPTQDLFTLPAGYRPTQELNFSVMAFNGSGSVTTASPITIKTDGTVRIANPASVPSTTNWQIYFDAISFLTT